jgi:hypothetical protein
MFRSATDKLKPKEIAYVGKVISQLTDLREALSGFQQQLETLTPLAIEPQFQNQWVPKAIEIVSIYLDEDKVLELTQSILEPVVAPVLNPLQSFHSAIMEIPDKLEWGKRFSRKLAGIADQIDEWIVEIQSDPVKYIRKQKQFSLSHKTNMNFPARAVVFSMLLLFWFVFILSPPVTAFTKGYSNPNILAVALCGFGAMCLAFFLSKDKKEFWLALVVGSAFGLLPYFCSPVASKIERQKKAISEQRIPKPEILKPRNSNEKQMKQKEPF